VADSGVAEPRGSRHQAAASRYRAAERGLRRGAIIGRRPLEPASIGENIAAPDALHLCGEKGDPAMPAKSKAQQKAAGAALSAKRGDTPKSKLKGASKSMMSMSEKQLEEFAHTKRKGKPEHASR
jgi:hypothetical protein